MLLSTNKSTIQKVYIEKNVFKTQIESKSGSYLKF